MRKRVIELINKGNEGTYWSLVICALDCGIEEGTWEGNL